MTDANSTREKYLLYCLMSTYFYTEKNKGESHTPFFFARLTFEEPDFKREITVMLPNDLWNQTVAVENTDLKREDISSFEEIAEAVAGYIDYHAKS